MGDHVQPDWLSKLPFDVLNLIAQRTRDPLTGLTTFRSVCRTWRAAVAPAPRLLPPSPQDAAVLRDCSDHMLVFPLSRGWSIVIDPLDMSCRLSHLATGTTAPLPNLNALCDGGDTSKITRLSRSEIELLFSREAAPQDVGTPEDPDKQSTNQEAYYFDDEDSISEDENEYEDGACEDGVCEDQNKSGSACKDGVCEDQTEHEDNACEDGVCEDQNKHEDSACEDNLCEDNAPSLNKGSTTVSEDPDEYLADVELSSFKEGTSCEHEHLTDREAQEDRRHKIKTYYEGREYYNTYIQFSNQFRFAIHVPDSTQGASTEGIVVMMYHHCLHGRTNGMVFCRPGDATWTMISNPNPKGHNFIDFAYFDGKVFALNNKCATLVFDDTTLNILYQVDVPPETSNFFSKMCGGDGSHKLLQSLHLLALPHKLLLVKVFMGESLSCEPVDFHVFELRHHSPDGQLAWCKVTGEGVGGNYELFMDSYHATFSKSGDGNETRIYHADNELFGDATCVWGYCYSMKDNKLECIHEPWRDDPNEYSTKPSWFVP